MDTATHLVMGITLGGLATLDPTIAQSNMGPQAVMLAAIVGSNIPDVDTVLKLQNNAKYIRNHRGITHSIPAVLLWTLLVTWFSHFIFPSSPYWHLLLWSFIAVFLHVFVDIFNAYGTQALRPFTKKWVALGVINTFDAVIFSIHALGVALIAIGANKGYTALFAYAVTILYYIGRIVMRQNVHSVVKKKFANVEQVIISPTYRFYHYHLAIVTDKFFYVARFHRGNILTHDKFERIPLPDNPVIHAALKDQNISAFLSFSPVYRWDLFEFDDHYEVRFIDLRYRSKDYYPFVAIVQLNKHLQVVSSYTGWIFSEEKLRKKLQLVPN
ncbi:metal-dependent hydrolase [Ectobacillus sp. JY-23]|uniref:metal-dependent hydrolase n=1 Tax=Ectobacillus sp. JY-23 TaxID=2933872 RepID=UPI001FF59F74|nr:metal-dependent hydrolase [Ectobacillus sp. JY-23]UOY91813.1 metal-dependent hydrolase [Ectobacillus sp. JY-23]